MSGHGGEEGMCPGTNILHVCQRMTIYLLLVNGSVKQNEVSLCRLPFLPASSNTNIAVQYLVLFLPSLTPEVCAGQVRAR